MKKINKMLVVLPLVLVFVLSSVPVSAWSTAKLTVNIKYGTETITKVYDTVNVTLKENDYTDTDTGNLLVDKFINEFLSGTAYLAPYKAGELEIDKTELKAILDEIKATPGSAVVMDLTLSDVPEDPKNKPIKFVVLDQVALPDLVAVPTLIHEFRNKDGADSWRDRAHELMSYETDRGNALKDYYLLGYAPDDNNRISDQEQAIMDELKVDFIIWVAKKMQPLSVTHVFPDRDPLYETIDVDYFVLTGNKINNYNAAEYAKTRIQKMNEMGYVFEKAEYSPWVYRSSILKIARDAIGNPLPTTFVLKGNGIFIYYKGAPIPAPVPEKDSEKKVDAASAQTGVQANVQQAVAPVAAAGQQQLPATGVADNAFLFLSSAALMALGIFFFKKH